MDPGNVVRQNQLTWNRFIEANRQRMLDWPLPEPPASSELSLVIIEPRADPHLEFALRNALRFIGPDWSVTWFHGRKNGEFARAIAARLGPVDLVALDVDDLSTVSYNELKKSAGLWERISAEYILWLEPDCLVCRRGIEDFFRYDYVGAPWARPLSVSPSCRVGNGGLSFRRRSSMLEISRRCNTSRQVVLTEDIFFVMNMMMCNRVQKNRFKLPTFDEARPFCVESVWHPRPFGLHKTWRYLKPKPFERLLGAIESLDA